MAKNQFVHLHCHTGGSVLDGHATVKEMVAEAAYLGQPAIAVTDHGGMHFAHELYQEAKEQGIKGIVGIEAYMTPGDASMTEKAPIFFGAKTKEERLEGAQDVSAGGAYTHMTLLAENNEGMHNLFKLTSLAWKEGYYKKPRMDIESLSNNSKGIIATTGCPSGELQTRLRLGQWDEAVKYVDKMQSIFGKENYFLELMDHDMKVDIERIVKDDLLKIGKYMDIPLLATNDLHYTRREQAKSHEQLLAVQSGSKMTDATYDNGGKRFAFSGEEFYVKSADEMEQVFGHLPTALTNTLLIAERCNVSFDYNDTLRPNVPLPTGMTETEFIKREAFEGLQRRLPEKANDKHYTQRLDMELSVLDLKGYNGYFLVTSDFVRWARNNGVEVGYGRGCLSGDSNVLTPNGFVKIKDIKVGDIVFNEYGEQIPVPEVFEYDCDEELVEIKAYYGGNGNKMTADHKVLVSKAGTKLSPEWMRADQVEINDYVVMPKISTVPEMHNLPDSGESTDVDGTCNYFSDENFHYYRVSEINIVPAEGKVYDFTVPGAHSYVTDSYVVHNSAGGSLVSYCLDITDLDPIRFDLLFERFINPERDSPPDIDMDFDDVGRDRVIQYVSATYGSDKVAQIVTFGKIGAKQAIKDSIRVLDEPYNLGDVLTKAIPPAQAGKEMKLKDLFDRKNARYEEGDNFREEVAKLANKDIITSALGLEGRMRSTGVHAAGVIISSKKLDESIPLFSRPKDGITITQFDYPTCESLGLLKFDFLGIRNLTIVAKAMAHIKRRHGITLNAVEIVNGPMDDAPTYELLRNGDTLGIFQLDSGGMRSLLKLIEPTEIGDILAVLALYRPGPMGMDSHIAYADRKNGRKPVVAPHPELETLFNDVMGDTYLICTYQEQLMKAAQVAAGYTLAQADNLRRAMGKKKMEVLQKEYVPFSAGMKENGYSDGAIKSLWDIFVPFAEYGFNKSHSAGYALLSYVTAYLKANYPAEYMAALLSCTMGDKDKTAIYLEECRRMGIEVSSPNVSSSLTEYTPVSDDNILVGMEAVRGVGYEVAKGIMDEATLKEFTDLTDFLSRVPSSALSKGVIEGLIDAGGFDSFGYTRRSLAQRLPDLAKGFSKVKKTEEKGQFDLFGALEELDDVEAPDISIPDLPEYTKKDKLARERHVLGLYVSDHPLSGMADTLDSYVSNHIVDIARGDLIASEGFGDKKDKVSFAGVVGSLIRKPSRKGEMFASFTVEDMTGTIEAVMFPKVYASFGHLLEPDGIYVATGSLLSKGENEVSFAVDSIEIIETTDSGEIPFMIRLGHEQTTAESLDMLEDTLRRHPGDQKVQLHVRENGLVNMTELGKDFNVRVSQNLKNEISYLFGINWM